MNRTILQVPMQKSLRDEAESAAHEQGFSSLQEIIRVFLQKLARNKIYIEVADQEERLSPKAERRYAKIVERIKNGKEKTIPFTNVDDMMKYLNS